jgi:hypothetical protein
MMSEADLGLSKGFAEAWIPEDEGDKIVGKITEISEAWSDQSESMYGILVIADEETNTEKAVHCFGFVLEREMKKLKPKEGERIGIRYGGTVPTKTAGRTVKVYKVKVEGRTASASVWDDDKPTQSIDPVPAPIDTTETQATEGDIPF